MNATIQDNFMEIEKLDEANLVDMRIWKFVTYDSGKYVFARRVKPIKGDVKNE